MVFPVLTDTNTAMAMTSRAASAIPNSLRPSKIKLRNRVEKAIRSGGLEFTRTAYQERGAKTLASWLCWETRLSERWVKGRPTYRDRRIYRSFGSETLTVNFNVRVAACRVFTRRAGQVIYIYPGRSKYRRNCIEHVYAASHHIQLLVSEFASFCSRDVLQFFMTFSFFLSFLFRERR